MPPAAEGPARHLARADALTAVGRHEEALKELDAALATEPQNARARCTRAMILYRLGRFHDALAEADRAVGLAPHLSWALRLRALSLLRLGRSPDEVLTVARAAVAADPQEWRSHEVMGDAYLHAHRWPDAGGEGRTIAALAPDDPEALISAARFVRHTAGIDSEQLLRRALALDPTNYRATINLGALLYNFGDRDEALRLFVAAARLEPTEDLATKNLLVAIGGRGTRALDPETARALKPLLDQQRRAHRRLAQGEAIGVLWLVPVLLGPIVGLVLATGVGGALGLVPFGAGVAVAVAAGIGWRGQKRRVRAEQHEVLRRYGKRASWATRSVELRAGNAATGKRPVRVTWLQIILIVGLLFAVAVSSRQHDSTAPPSIPDYSTAPTPLSAPDATCDAERSVWVQRLEVWNSTHPAGPPPDPTDLFPEGVPHPETGPRFTVGPAGTVLPVPGGGC